MNKNTITILHLLKEGFRPLKISAHSGVPIVVVVKELTAAVQARDIPRSQVLGVFDGDILAQLRLWFSVGKKQPRLTAETIHQIMKESNPAELDLTVEEIKLCQFCLERGFTDSDLYEALVEIECTLHAQIKLILAEKYGSGEDGWWRNGIPKNVREECVSRREGDDDFVENAPYNFLTFGQLERIIDSQKALFQTRLPAGAKNKPADIRSISEDLKRLTKIRNKVMHPIKTARPTEDEFFFVKDMREKLKVTKWR